MNLTRKYFNCLWSNPVLGRRVYHSRRRCRAVMPVIIWVRPVGGGGGRAGHPATTLIRGTPRHIYPRWITSPEVMSGRKTTSYPNSITLPSFHLKCRRRYIIFSIWLLQPLRCSAVPPRVSSRYPEGSMLTSRIGRH